MPLAGAGRSSGRRVPQPRGVTVGLAVGHGLHGRHVRGRIGVQDAAGAGARAGGCRRAGRARDARQRLAAGGAAGAQQLPHGAQLLHPRGMGQRLRICCGHYIAGRVQAPMPGLRQSARCGSVRGGVKGPGQAPALCDAGPVAGPGLLPVQRCCPDPACARRTR